MPAALVRVALLVALALSWGVRAAAEDWPAWRGPRGDGTSLETGLPVTWSDTENIAWKVAIPGVGHASPIVWREQIFLVTCLEQRNQRVLLCIDRRTGETLWQQTVLEAPLEGKHTLNSFASSTAATDGHSVFVSFLDTSAESTAGQQMLVAAFDLQGNPLWTARPGGFSSKHGYCSSPVLFEDLVIINGDHDGNSYLVALEKATGKLVWQTPREHKTRSYVTPILRNFDGRQQLILSGSRCVASYDPRTGARHWYLDGPTEQFVASLVDNGRLLFMTAGFPDKHIMAIRPDGRGNITPDSHVVWHTTENAAYVPSPVICGDYLVVVADQGIASCFEADSGQRLWRERIGPRYSASLVSAQGLVYLTSDRGVTTVLRPGPEFDVVATNDLGEDCFASPALSQGQMIFRSEHHLWAIGQTDSQ